MRKLFTVTIFFLSLTPAFSQTLPGRYDLSQDVQFQKALRVALVEAAIAIAGEAPSVSPGVGNKRDALAAAVLANVNLVVDRFALPVAADSTVSVTNDTAIRNRVNAIWNDMAGVKVGD